MQKCGFVVLSKAAQGFAVRRTHVRRSRKPAENAAQDHKDHFWTDTLAADKLWRPFFEEGHDALARPQPPQRHGPNPA